jgi:hypothetical protein
VGRGWEHQERALPPSGSRRQQGGAHLLFTSAESSEGPTGLIIKCVIKV